jgi:biopolymer transport protein ExbD
MAMSVPAAGGVDDGSGGVLSEINTTPLVDVMLVLLIIFLITIPVANHSVPVDLPKQRNELRQATPKDIVISVDAQGRIHWFDAPVAGTAALTERLKSVARQDPQPEVHIRADGRGDYAPVGRVLAACQRAGIFKVGFITEPPPRS